MGIVEGQAHSLEKGLTCWWLQEETMILFGKL